MKSYIIGIILVLSVASIGYGATDGYAPKPDPMTWRFVPAAMGPTTIYMRATAALDANDMPVKYYFECTDHPEASSGWVSDANYTAAGLAPGTTYSFRVKTCDNNGGDPNTQGHWSSTTPSATTDADTTAPVLKLDLNNTANNDDANTQTGFVPFILESSGSEVNGVIIDLEGDLQSARCDDPSGAMEMYDKFFGSIVPDPCWYNPRAGERIYRDFIYGTNQSGVTITLWDLGVNRDCNITIWAYDSGSIGETNRVANWYGNGEYIFDTSFTGGATGWPRYDNQTGGAADLYKYSFSGRATTDYLGRLILTSSRDPESPEDEPFAFVNAIVVEPNTAVPFVPTKYAQHPLPFDGTEDVPIDVILEWKESIYAEKHDVYLGTDETEVTAANRNNPLDVLVSLNHSTTTYDPPGLLKLNTTYYWRIDEVNAAPDYTIFKGEIWSFTTESGVAKNPSPPDGATSVDLDADLTWTPGSKAETHDVYFGTDFNDVNDANNMWPVGTSVYKGNQDINNYAPGVFDLNTTYYWRIDEINDSNNWKGNVWSFTACFTVLEPPETVRRIISWNIEFLGTRDDPPRTQEQHDAIAQRILTFDAAVLALQEIYDGAVLEYIRSQLGPSWQTYFSGAENALLYDTNQVEMLSVEMLNNLDNPPYTPYPHEWGTPVSGVFRPVRMYTEPFRVIGVHCDDSDAGIRTAEGIWLRTKIIEFLADPEEPNDIILLGDLNGSHSSTPPHPQLQEGNYIHLLPKENGKSTLVGTVGLDHFYVTQDVNDKLPKQSSFVVRPEYYGETPGEFHATYSDHYPIFVDFEPDPRTDLFDFALFAAHWLESGCGFENNWCGSADLDGDEDVDFNDLNRFVDNWLIGAEW